MFHHSTDIILSKLYCPSTLMCVWVRKVWVCVCVCLTILSLLSVTASFQEEVSRDPQVHHGDGGIEQSAAGCRDDRGSHFHAWLRSALGEKNKNKNKKTPRGWTQEEIWGRKQREMDTGVNLWWETENKGPRIRHFSLQYITQKWYFTFTCSLTSTADSEYTVYLYLNTSCLQYPCKTEAFRGLYAKITR